MEELQTVPPLARQAGDLRAMYPEGDLDLPPTNRAVPRQRKAVDFLTQMKRSSVVLRGCRVRLDECVFGVFGRV